jgi:endo-1,4-beta-xylanase
MEDRQEPRPGKPAKPDAIDAGIAPAAVQARIRKLRMGRLLVKTRPGADVEVRQLRHEFLFGTAVPDELAEKAPRAMSGRDRKMYLKTLGENFNYAVHENALKWYDCEPREGKVDYYLADRIWELCHERNIPMRGHCIFWEKDQFNLPWLHQLDNERLRAAVRRRVLGVTEHFRGRITEFDLNNEMINGDFFRRRLGYGVLNEMAWMAKAGNPEVRLFVNDYGILAEGGFNLETYLTQIRNLQESGVPIDGIGCQGHSATDHPANLSARHVQSALDRLSQFGLPIKITEALFDSGDEKDEAEEMKTILPLYFAHPAVEAVIIWGFWAGTHWRPWSALWRKDWSVTPQGEVFRDLVFRQWWTRASGTADASGKFQTEAFFGDYAVTSQGKTREASFGRKKKTLTVAMD